MKKQLYSKIVLFLFLLQILQFSQFNVKATDGSGVKVAVTISAMATVIGPILLPQDNITVLLPANVEPHSFTLDPITLDKAMQADIIVTSGHIGWEDQLEKIAAEKGKIVFNPLKELYNNLTILDVPGGGKNLHGYWLYPENVIVTAEEFMRIVSKIKPSAAKEYESNLRRYIEDIGRLKNFAIETSKSIGLLGKNVLIGFYEEQYVAKSLGLNVTEVLAGSEENLDISPQKIETIRRELVEGYIQYIMVSDVARELPIYNYIEKLSEETGVNIVLVRVLDLPNVYDFRNLFAYNIGRVGMIGKGSSKVSNPIEANVFFEAFIVSLIVNLILVYLLFRRVRE
ncbi:MAG: metal ABC transporter substrate-binding protein [Nitrososphaeria archaeon]